MWDKELEKVGLVDRPQLRALRAIRLMYLLQTIFFEEYWKLIAHGREARLAWEARQAKLAK